MKRDLQVVYPGTRVDSVSAGMLSDCRRSRWLGRHGAKGRIFLFNFPFCNCNQAITTDSGYISLTILYAKHMAISEIVIVYIFIIVCEGYIWIRTLLLS